MMRELKDLELEQLCGQLLVVGFEGSSLPAELQQAFAEGRRGGAIFFGRNLQSAEQAHALCLQVLQHSPRALPPLITIDQEGGRVQRIRSGVLQLPPMRRLGEHNDTALTHAVAQELGRQLGILGFNLNFAPVVDVDSNPDNPVIGDRAFSADPRRVVEHGRAFLRGMQNSNVAGCLKHYPGHGDTHLDSHLDLPVVDRDAVALRQQELYPFERLLVEAWAAMSAHVVFPAFDSVPATLSPRLLTTLLRREFAFDGVLFSDDLEMGALSKHWPIEKTAVKAVQAGCDALLVCKNLELQERALTALVEAARRDDSFRVRCVQAAERSLALRLRCRPNPAKDWEHAQTALWTERSTQLQDALTQLSANSD